MKHWFYPTTAALLAVVFLLTLAGCASADADAPLFSRTTGVSEADAADGTVAKPRRKRRKASDYSRIPVNAPADWQRATMGI